MRGMVNKHHRYGQPIPQPPSAKHQLWISGQDFASNAQHLNKQEITAVCSLTTDPFELPHHVKHLTLTLEDTLDEDISRYFQLIFEFIEKEREHGHVLVHCVAGVSRSATVCCYYLMRKWRWRTEEGLSCIREARPWVRPNDGFYRQLKKAEGELGLGPLRARF